MFSIILYYKINYNIYSLNLFLYNLCIFNYLIVLVSLNNLHIFHCKPVFTGIEDYEN